MPKPPREFKQPAFTPEEMETFIWSTVIDGLHPDMIIALLMATIYGCRLGEIAALRPEDIQITGDKASVYIRTEKNGQMKSQPIPKELIPLFAVPFAPTKPRMLLDKLQRLSKKIGVLLPERSGYHSFRRRVATDIFEVEKSELNVHNFMRWSAPRQYTMLARYRQTPTEVTDMQILRVHPYVAMWEKTLPFIFKYNPYYYSLNDITK